MHPYRVIVSTYRWSDSLSTIPDVLNTLTRQSTATNNAPRDTPSRPRYKSEALLSSDPPLVKKPGSGCGGGNMTFKKYPPPPREELPLSE